MGVTCSPSKGVRVRRQLVDGAQRGFHNTARDAEDVGGAGGEAQGIVKLSVGQAGKVDTGGFDHAGQLAGCEDGVHVGITVVLHLGALNLVFFAVQGMMETTKKSWPTRRSCRRSS